MSSVLDRHPHARAVLGPAFAGDGPASHAYLFHGPGGSGKRSTAREFAAALLAEGAPDPAGVRARVHSGVHPDLTWVSPSGAHEVLVSDIDGPVVTAATRTPFEARRRVFVIERADQLGDEAANRMLKTLEEPPSYVHLILLTDRVTEVLPTIRSRCQLVRFEPPRLDQIAARIEADGAPVEAAAACARLGLGDAEAASRLASPSGMVLRAAAEAFARAPLAGRAPGGRPWAELMAAVRAQGEMVRVELEEQARAELELVSKKERKRVDTESSDRVRRVRRRVETGALDLALQLVSLWYRDLACLIWDAEDLVAHVDRLTELREDGGCDPRRLRAAVDLVEETRRRFQLNVTEELACEALAYRLEATLG
jgi:DNA polymerase-3 subunit delta'